LSNQSQIIIIIMIFKINMIEVNHFLMTNDYNLIEYVFFFLTLQYISIKFLLNLESKMNCFKSS